MTLTLCGRIGILWFVARAWPLTLVCAHRQTSDDKQENVFENLVQWYIYWFAVPMYAFDATWSQARHHTHRATRASLSFAGQRHYVVSVLGVFHVICFVCQFGFANALLFYSASVLNQTLVVNELTRVFYDTAHYDIGKCVFFMVIINVVNFAAQLLGKPSLVQCCDCWCSGPTWFQGIGYHNTELACNPQIIAV